MSATASDELTTLLAVIVLVFAPLLLWWFTLRVRKGVRYAFRRIRAFDALRGVFARAAENGKTVHLALGSSGIADAHTAIVSSGLAMLRHLADQGASLGTSPTVTVADPALLIVAQDTLRRAYEKRGRSASYSSTDVRLIAPDPAAYAIGAQDVVDDEAIAANAMIGHFGQEYLLVGEAGAQRDLPQMVGSDDLDAQPFLVATTDRALLGEEAFAAGAYLTERPEHIASLRLQDILRLAVVVVILGGVLIKTLLG